MLFDFAVPTSIHTLLKVHNRQLKIKKISLITKLANKSTIQSEESAAVPPDPVSTDAAVVVTATNQAASLTPQASPHLNELASTNKNNETADIEEEAEASVLPPLHSVFSARQKTLIVLMTSLGSLFSPLSSFIYLPALNTLASNLHVSNASINLTVTSYMICQGLAPMFFGDFSDMAGRRPAYIITFFIYFCANVGLALQSNYAALFVLRALQSTGSSGTIALGNGVIADISTSAERGKYIGWVQIGTQLGPGLAPTIGGILAQFLGWRAIFWFLAIFGGIYLIAYFLFVPETGRNVVGDGSIPPEGWNRNLVDILHQQKSKAKALAEADSQKETNVAREKLTKTRRLRFPNPLNALRIVVEKDMALILFFIALMITGFYVLIVPFPSILKEHYGFNELKIGLCFMCVDLRCKVILTPLTLLTFPLRPFSVGSAAGGVCCGRVLDYNYRRVARQIGVSVDRKRGNDLRNFPIERARLEVVFYPLFLGLACIVAWGWILQARTSLAAPLVVIFFAGFFLSGCMSMLSALLVDLYPQNPATAMAASNVTRCSMGAVATAVVQHMIDAMGIGWTYTIFGGLAMACTPCLWVVMKWGPRWREARFVREASKAERKK